MNVFVDIGGTHVRLAHGKQTGVLSNVTLKETPKTYDALIRLIQEYIATLDRVARIIIGIPGMRDTQGTIVTPSPFLAYCAGKHLAQDIGFPDITHLFNDAFLVGIGEAVFGAGKAYDADRCAYITISTGVGGAVFHKRHVRKGSTELDEMRSGFLQFEPGKHIIDHAALKSVEHLISGGSVAQETGKHPREITDEAFWDEKARILAVALWNVCVMWSPELIIVGGPMVVRSPGIRIERVEAHMRHMNTAHVTIPPIILGTMGDEGGVYGGKAVAALL